MAFELPEDVRMVKKKEFNEQYLKHSLTAEFYASISPAISRIFMANAREMAESGDIDDKNRLSIPTCAYCGNILTPKNTKVRIRQSRRLHFKYLRKLQEKSERGDHMGKLQQKLLEREMKSNVAKAIKCLVCNKSECLPLGKKDKRIASRKPMTNDGAPKKKKKRKRKKEEDAGLINRSAMESSKSSNPSAIVSQPNIVSTPTSSSPNPCKRSADPKSKQKTLPSPTNAKTEKKRKIQGSHNVLQKMLKQQQEKKQNQSNALGDFLSSI